MNKSLSHPKSATALAAAIASITLTLSACGGSGNNGTYFTEGVNGTSDLGRLVVEGDTVTHTEYECDGVYDDPSILSTGEFNEDRTQVTWTVAGDDERNDRTGTETVSTSENSITVGEDVYVLEDSDPGQALMNSFEAECKDD